MVLGLTACGSGEDQENTENESAAGTAVQVQSVTLESIATENTVSGRWRQRMNPPFFRLRGGQVHRREL